MRKNLIVELSREEMINIYGGKSVYYWIGYALGAATGTAYSLLCGITNGLEGQHK
ncbi:MAG TPA: hypothetical protein VK213_03940 [Bacteroidales bacterium]|nr:hypothetical protein [Bacteroidales bacterium]